MGISGGIPPPSRQFVRVCNRETDLDKDRSNAARCSASEIERHIVFGSRCQNTLDGSDYIYRGVDQGAIDVKQVDRKSWNQAG